MPSSESPSADRMPPPPDVPAPAPRRTPVVGVTTAAGPVRESPNGPPVEAAYVDAAYLAAARGAGLLPVLLPPGDPGDPGDVGRALSLVDALLLTGGEDVDPAHYGAPPHPAAGPFAAARDRWELALARGARERGLPTLAICRGTQLLAVAFGGTLAQHLADGDAERGARHDRPADRRDRVHAVAVDPGSPLAAALGATHFAVNSYHHQAVAGLGPPLRAAAWADDGVLEGVASADPAWPALGVQWHPEDLAADPDAPDRRLFAWLAEAGRATERREPSVQSAP